MMRGGRSLTGIEGQLRKFAEGNSANTFLLPGAPHYVYINHEAEVVRWMRKFLGIPLKF